MAGGCHQTICCQRFGELLEVQAESCSGTPGYITSCLAGVANCQDEPEAPVKIDSVGAALADMKARCKTVMNYLAQFVKISTVDLV